MSAELFEEAIQRYPAYKDFIMHTNVKLKVGEQVTSIVGYMDVDNGGVLVKEALKQGESAGHLWYINDLEVVKTI